MSTAQAMINAGLNYFGAQLLAESLLRTPLSTVIAKRGNPLKVMIPINRPDCKGWSGVEIMLNPIKAEEGQEKQIPDQYIEFITWHDANTTKPDTDTTVLCCRDEDFFMGYWDDERNAWISCECGGIIDGVTHWADPKGPERK